MFKSSRHEVRDFTTLNPSSGQGISELYHRIREQLELEGTSGGCLIQNPCSSRAT